MIEVEIARESRGLIVKQASKPGCDIEPRVGDGKKIPYKVINAKFRLLAQHANKVMLPQGDVSLVAIPISVAFNDIFEFLQYEEIGAPSTTIYME